MEKIKIKEKDDINKIKASKKKCLFKVFLLIFIFILVISIGVLLFLYIKKNKSKVYVIKSDSLTNNIESLSLTEFQNKLDEEKNNSITAVYSLQKNEESVFFNPKNIGLSDNSYKIEVLSVKNEDDIPTQNTLRNLEDISYKFLSQINGKIEIRITFYIVLVSMFKLFKGCKNLIEIDLSKLDTSNLKDLDSTFENCSNLKFANLNMPNGQKVELMDNSFTGCQKLENVDLTEFEPKKNISMQNMFKNCANLNYIDLSNFHSYNFDGIFLGCLNIVININTQENSKQDLNELINNTKVECQIGQDAKCKQCMEGKNTIYCDDCNEGYYIPYKKKRTECIKCEDNCLECFGLVTFSYCYKCKEGYESINGKCEKKEDKKEGSNEIQETYKPNYKCNEGYYISEENKTECIKCSMDGCRACPNNISIDCFNDTEINYPNIDDDEEAKRKIMKENNIKPTWSDKIYYNNYSEYLSNGLKIDRHYIWNKYKRKMIEILGIYHINNSNSGIYAYNEQNQSYYSEGFKFNNEYFQSVLQKYEFTFIDHIYEKNQKYYKYNYQTLAFDEIQGDLKCKYEIGKVKIESIEQDLSFISTDINKPNISTESSMINEEFITTTLPSIDDISSTLIESNEKKCVIGENEKCKSCDLNRIL